MSYVINNSELSENISNYMWDQNPKETVILVTLIKGKLLCFENNKGVIGFPGGGIDEGETPATAAKREFAEEVHSNIDEVEVKFQFRMGERHNTVHVYTAELSEEVQERIAQRLTPEFLATRDTREGFPFLMDIKDFVEVKSPYQTFNLVALWRVGVVKPECEETLDTHEFFESVYNIKD